MCFRLIAADYQNIFYKLLSWSPTGSETHIFPALHHRAVRSARGRRPRLLISRSNAICLRVAFAPHTKRPDMRCDCDSNIWGRLIIKFANKIMERWTWQMRICDNMPSIKHVLCATSLSKLAIDMFRLRYHHFEQPNVEVKLTLSAPQTRLAKKNICINYFNETPVKPIPAVRIADFCSIITVCISQSPHHLLYGFEKYLSNRAVKLEHSPCWVENLQW